MTMASAGPAPAGGVQLTAALTYHGPPAGADDTAAVLRQLAARAAVQPAPPLGPVVYVRSAIWDLGPRGPHQGLDFRSHDAIINQDWRGAAGEAFEVRRPDGRPPGDGVVADGYTRADPGRNEYWARNKPAAVPAGRAALRRYLLSLLVPTVFPESGVVYTRGTGQPGATIPARAVAPILAQPARAAGIFSEALQLMRSEPLRPAVRAQLLRLMATAARQLPGSYHFFNLGSVTDRAGHRGVAIGYTSTSLVIVNPSRYHTLWQIIRHPDRHRLQFVTSRAPELSVFIFDPATGALDGVEYAACTGPVTSASAATSRCSPASYSQLLQIKAVPALPPPPSAHHPAATAAP
jgi:hypothetical protein